MSQFWRLDGPLQTLVLAAKQKRLPQVIYWGPPLPASDDCTALAAAHALDVTGGMLDANPDLSICPEASQILSRSTGSHLPRCAGARAAPGISLCKRPGTGDKTYASPMRTKIWA